MPLTHATAKTRTKAKSKFDPELNRRVPGFSSERLVYRHAYCVNHGALGAFCGVVEAGWVFLCPAGCWFVAEPPR